MSQRPALTRFARILLTMGSGESAWLVMAFLLGAVALGVLANLIYDALSRPSSMPPGAFVWVLLWVAGFVLLAYLAYRRDLNLALKKRAIDADIHEDTAPPHAGLVWLLSLGSLDLPLLAMRHHCSSAGAQHLRHCWMLLTPDVQQAGAFERLEERVKELGLDLQLHPVVLKAGSVEDVYAAMEEVYLRAASAKEVALASDEIISDITGGTKQMTAGMVLACLPNGWPLEYVVSQRHPATGAPIEGTQKVIIVGVDFRLGR